jgi:hypothetical protein
MAETGKLNYGQRTVQVIYSYNSQNKAFEITDFEPAGNELLSDLEPGLEIMLTTEKGVQIRLLVKELKIGRNVACQAVEI